MQWRKREGHDSYQEVEVYIYKHIYRETNIRQETVALLWSGLGHIHILAMVVMQLKLEELAKVVVNRHLNPEDCSGMTWAESEGLCLIKVEIRHDLEGRKNDRN